MSIRWITPQLGTGPALQVRQESGLNIIDVRDLVDKPGNRCDAVRQKIQEGCDSLRAGKKTVVCCDYGISRSNAVAAGILAVYESISFEAAVWRVLEATGEKDIKAPLLQVVRLALGANKKQGYCQKRRVLLTGGSGFLGKPISQKLAAQYEVFAPNRSELDLQLGSTKLDLIVSSNEIDCIVHLANPRIYTSNIALGHTLTMLRNVLDVCVAHEVRLIYLSCLEVYSGYRANCLHADESLPLLPKGPYGESKYLAELMIEHFRHNHGLRCTMLRSSPVYGAGGEKPKFIYNFLDKIRRMRRVVTHCYKNGVPALDLLYIDDLVSAVVKAVASDFNVNLNIGTGVVTSTKRVAEILMDLLGVSSDIESTLIDDYTAIIAMDATKARETLNWKPTIYVEQGLQMIAARIETTLKGVNDD